MAFTLKGTWNYDRMEDNPRFWEPDQLSSEALIAVLMDRYRADVLPRCRVCGEELTMADSGGRLGTEWACQGHEKPNQDGKWVYKPGRSFCDQHYMDSGVTQNLRGDAKVLELIDRFAQCRGIDLTGIDIPDNT